MSGKPLKTPSDANKAKNEYLEMLNLSISLNETNFQSNKAYIANGTLPAITQMSDTRSINDILQDYEGLKASIVKDLKNIGEPMFISNVIDKVNESNLNVSGSLIRYLAQNAPSIADMISRKYKFGIKGDDNDVETLVQQINNLYINTRNTLQSIRGYVNSVSSNQSKGDVLSSNDMDRIIKELEDYKKRIVITGVKLHMDNETFQAFIITLETIEKIIPSTNELKMLIENIDNDTLINPFNQSDDLKELFDMLNYLPKFGTIQTLFDMLDKSLRNNNPGLTDQVMTNLRSEFDTFINTVNLERLNYLYDNVILPVRRNLINGYRNNNEIMRTAQYRHEQELKGAKQVIVMNDETNPVWIQSNNSSYLPSSSIPSSSSSSIPSSSSSSSSSLPSSSSSSSSSLPIRPINNNPRNYANDAKNIVINRAIDKLSPSELNAICDEIANINGVQLFGIDELRDYLLNNKDYNKGDYGIAGLGLKKRRGRPRGSGLPKPELIKVANYVGFGINEVSKKNLDKSILSVRRNTKTNIMELPSRHISDKMKRIINSVIGGGIPNINDLNSLDEDEKEYLNKLISKSNLQDRVSVPTPSKDIQEKDIHSFEVMKGEIMAGNDSKDMVKKFKLLVLKLSRNGLLPKNESKELLETLVELGY